MTVVELEVERDDDVRTVAVSLEWEDGWDVIEAVDGDGHLVELTHQEELEARDAAEAAHAGLEDVDDYDAGPTDAECDVAARAWFGSRLRDPKE